MPTWRRSLALALGLVGLLPTAAAVSGATWVGCVTGPTSTYASFAIGSVTESACPSSCLGIGNYLYAYWQQSQSSCTCGNTSPVASQYEASTFTSTSTGTGHACNDYSAYVTDTTFTGFESGLTCLTGYTTVNPVTLTTYATVEQCFQSCRPNGIAAFSVDASGFHCRCIDDSNIVNMNTDTACHANSYYAFTHSAGDYVTDTHGPASPQASQWVKRALRQRAELAGQAALKHALCPERATACAVEGSPGSYECLDTQWELESCGGCVHGALDDVAATGGTDCTTLPGVDVNSVSCVQGVCRALACRTGWALTGNGTCAA